MPLFSYSLHIYYLYRDCFPVSIVPPPKNLAGVAAAKFLVNGVGIVLYAFAEGIEAETVVLAVTLHYYGADYIIILVMGCVGSKSGSGGSLRRNCPQQHCLKYKMRGQVSK